MQHGAHLVEFVCRQMCFLRRNKDVHLVKRVFFSYKVFHNLEMLVGDACKILSFSYEMNWTCTKNAKKHQQTFTLPAKRRWMLRQSQSLYSNFCRYWCLTTFGRAVKASTRKYRQTIGSWLRSADWFIIFRQETKQDKTGQKRGYQKQERKTNKKQNRTLLTGFDEVDYQSISL